MTLAGHRRDSRLKGLLLSNSNMAPKCNISKSFGNYRVFKISPYHLVHSEIPPSLRLTDVEHVLQDIVMCISMVG